MHPDKKYQMNHVSNLICIIIQSLEIEIVNVYKIDISLFQRSISTLFHSYDYMR